MTDKELKAQFAALMQQMNDNHERVMDRLTSLEGDVRDLRSEHGVTRTLVTALPATVLGAIEGPLLRRIRTVEGRLTKLENDDAA